MDSWIQELEWGLRNNMELKDNILTYEDSSKVIHEIDVTKNSFNFHSSEEIKKDVPLKGKPTTYGKDVVRRLFKNKSSLVSMIILGIMVLVALIVPTVLNFDTTGATTVGLAYLPPKIFSNANGFWDGTKQYTDIVYNPSTGLPDGNFTSSAIVSNSIKTYEGSLDNNPNQYAKGGYIRIGSTGGADYIWSNSSLNLDSSSNIVLSYEMDSEINTQYNPVAYYISLAYSIALEDGSSSITTLPLVENSIDFGIIENIDVSAIMNNAGLTSLNNATIRVGIYGDNEERFEGVFLKSLSFTIDGEDTSFSFSDANSALLSSNWKTSSAGSSGLSSATITYCSFRYDPYSVVYGEYESVYSVNDMNALVDKGYCKYDIEVGESSFEILDDLCPVVEVIKQESITAAGITTTQIKVKVSKYKELGFANMPYHVFGTDASGIDMFKYVSEGLRNSLGMAILISVICLSFGLVFGAIEGYFGGYVDLVLERIVDILANIPSIILITLCVLHLGQNFGVFIFAMCMTGWIGTAGITRTQFYRFKRREYVLAARSLGASDTRLIFKHILPNSIGTIVTSSVLIIPSVIFSEASISYLGIGLTDMASLGKIISDNQVNVGTNQYLLLFPSFILALLLICFNLFGNGLRDAFNPSTKGAD